MNRQSDNPTIHRLPAPLGDYFFGLTLADRKPAYLLLDAAGVLKDSGGMLAQYGLETMQEDELPDLPFMTDLLPLKESPLVLPYVALDNGRYADIHLIGENEAVWLFFLDATKQVSSQQLLQQKANDLRLLQAHHTGTIDMSVLSKLFGTLDMVILERQPDQKFTLLTPPPDWLLEFMPGLESGRTDIDPGEGFPFLAHFMMDADAFWTAASSGHLKSGQWTEISDLGHEYELEATAVSMNGQALLLIEFPKMDSTEKQQILQKGRDIHLAHQQLQQEIQQKDVLLHCIVHDLKGPLAVMKGVFSLIASGAIQADKAQELLTSGQQHVARQERMIQDILDAFSAEVANWESFSVDPEQAPDALTCARSIVDGLFADATRRQINLLIAPDVDQQADWRVVGEASRLERIYSNLIENALRHSPPNTFITVAIRESDEDTFLITIDDEGPGVPEEIMDTLFDKFTQGGKGSGTSGLGLYFCRITVERWGGEIGVENRPEGGARFWFKLKKP